MQTAEHRERHLNPHLHPASLCPPANIHVTQPSRKRSNPDPSQLETSTPQSRQEYSQSRKGSSRQQEPANTYFASSSAHRRGELETTPGVHPIANQGRDFTTRSYPEVNPLAWRPNTFRAIARGRRNGQITGSLGQRQRARAEGFGCVQGDVACGCLAAGGDLGWG